MTTNFKIRKTSPAASNKWYIKTTKGGYNKAALISEKTGSVLPNCTGLVHGRWLECVGSTNIKDDNLYLGNASGYYGKKDGYTRSQTPAVGSVGCYSGGSSGEGHVIFVEAVASDGTISFSESAYDGKRYRFGILKKPYKYSDNYQLQGFILNPLIKEVKEETALKVGDKVTIIKKGNAQASGKGKAAYGLTWKRQILKIQKGALYPYCVGLNGIATGWYQANALKKGWK